MTLTEWPPSGVKWYYSDEAVCIAHGDCRDILPLLPKVDLVLTDPPYGIDYQSSRRIGWQRKDKIVGDDEFPLWLFEVVKPSVAMFVWCRWDILSILPKPKSFIVWDKCCHSMGDLQHEFGRQWEACAFYPGPNHRFVNRPIDVIRCPRIPPDKLIHPNEKPVGAVSPLIVAHDDGLIFDPFAGSCTTGRAAKNLGRKCICIEIEEKYCEEGAKRMGQGVLL